MRSAEPALSCERLWVVQYKASPSRTPPLVADIPPADPPIPKQRRGLSRIQHRFRSGERPPPGEQEGRGPKAEQPVGRGHEDREPFDHRTGLSCARRRRWPLADRADEAIERRKIRVSRVLLAKPIQRIAGALEPSFEERGHEVVDEDDFPAVEEEVRCICPRERTRRRVRHQGAADDGEAGAFLIP